ncbi:MAG: hypothetical protein AUG49_20875 [Catenulispora sp. 13_1_20CM_3_70_7]|jgi:hypothetical protein|nr:MAG: hypothetical protein AUG49_20875 [Catenulispora sp. 13_1_20CM_3_70_7]
MKYLLLIYSNDEKWAAIPEEVREKEVAKQAAWNAQYMASGELLAAYGLGSETEASLIRRKDDAPFVTDGPYLEAKEFVGSLYVIEAPTPERAREIAADLPWAVENPVEMWPILYEWK